VIEVTQACVACGEQPIVFGQVRLEWQQNQNSNLLSFLARHALEVPVRSERLYWS
jgi:hypothetical protein